MLARLNFILLWMGESLFVLAASVMAFAAGVWVFQHTGSVEGLALVMISSSLPSILIFPFAGILADHFDRRLIILICDIATLILILFLAYINHSGALAPLHMYIFAAIHSALSTLRRPSYISTVSTLVPANKLTQANSILGLTAGLIQIGAPLLSAYAITSTDFKGVVSMQFLAMAMGLTAIYGGLRMSGELKHTKPKNRSIALNVSVNFHLLLQYFRRFPLMRSLLLYVLIHDALLALLSVLITPMVLASHSTKTLALVMATGAIGHIAGAFLLLILPTSKYELMRWMLGSNMGLAAFAIWAGVATGPDLWQLCAFGAFGCGAIAQICGTTLWMRKLPQAIQGSALAAVSGISMLGVCLVLMGGCALVERVLEPMAQAQHIYTGSLFNYLVHGKGRGAALLFIAVGCLFLVIFIFAYMHPRMRYLDKHVPDRPEVPPGPFPILAASRR